MGEKKRYGVVAPVSGKPLLEEIIVVHEGVDR
jgi:hypothetical protein